MKKKNESTLSSPSILYMLKNTIGGIEDPFEVGNRSEVALPNLYLFVLFLIPLARNSFEHLEVLSLCI